MQFYFTSFQWSIREILSSFKQSIRKNRKKIEIACITEDACNNCEKV